MSEPEAQNEPTMEEILASIRRIISEDESEEGKPAEAEAETAPAPAAATPEKPVEAAPAAPPPAADPSSGGADNILDLTKMVAEDGSIVDLAAQEEADLVGPAEEAVAAAEPVGEAEPEMDSDAAAEETAAAPEEEEPAEELLKSAEAAEGAEAEAAEEAPAEQADAGFEEPSEEPAQEITAEEAPQEAGLGQELAPAEGGNEYVSAETATAATASLAAVTKAAMANRQGDAIAIGGGRTLEELVRESLAPELKTWLDENLPDLVERIVREEIRKMVRRAEDQ